MQKVYQGVYHEEGHVDFINIGTLLSVHFDGHEVLVQNAGDVLVLEGLALHHVAPVTRRISHYPSTNIGKLSNGKISMLISNMLIIK